MKLAATVKGVGGEVFQVATNAEATIGELVESLLPILEEAGVSDVRVRHAAPRLGDVRRNYSDTSKVRRTLGWRQEVPLEESLRRAIA